MGKTVGTTRTCNVCGLKKPAVDLFPCEMVRENIAKLIRPECPNWSGKGFICRTDLDRFRAEYVKRLLQEDQGELSRLELDVVRSIHEQETVSSNTNRDFDRNLTFGQRIADRMADFGGSWTFIFIFAAVMTGWITVNTIALLASHFDPYPYILLNLILSCLAAIQAPIIMMSQNRQEARDRMHAEHDFRVNLKAELEIRMLDEKLDHLLKHQWQRLLEIQEIQTELMEELAAGHGRRGKQGRR